MFSSFFRSKKWVFWAYGGLFVIIVSLIFQTRLNVAINNWYKDFYVSLEEVSNPPLTKLNNIINIDIYDKYGNFIENINSFKLLKEKYEIPSSKLKDIQQGDKHFNDYIFKYNK